MKTVSIPRLGLDKTTALVTIIVLGTIAYLFLRSAICLFCEHLARPLFLGM